ncbi:MAG TPA: 50S ribosomal protein L25/general stress protein Ctc [Gemmatimonadota bacterium]|jgi:large subunit ribosomal protein L25
MAARTATVEALRRDRTGKGAARSARRGGRIPAVLYGHGEESLALSVDGRRFERLLHEISVENTLLDLALDGQPALKVLVREIQRHPHRDEILHVDFFHVSMQEKITLEVPVVLVGTPRGVRLHGGILDHSMRDIEVLCLPSDIPEKVEIDVGELEIGQSVRISDLSIPNVQILGDADRSVVSVVPPTVIEEAAPEVEAAAEGAEPEVIAKGKEEEPGAAAAGKEKGPAPKEKAAAAGKEKAPAGGKEKK